MKGKNYLLVIAIDKYQNEAFPNLNNAKLDAERFIHILATKYNFELAQSPFFDESATRKNIVEAVNHLTGFLTIDDNIIIYFAGHGEINPKTRKGFWIPTDADKSIGDYIPNSTVIDAIEGIEAKHILLVSDSCFSGTFLEQTRAKSDFHYSKIEQLKSRWVIASGRLENVSDGEPGVGSPFSIALIDFLENNKSNTVSFLELATHVTKETGIASKQQPIIAHIQGVGHCGGQLVFKLVDEHIKPLFDEDLSRLSVSYDTAVKLQQLGFLQKSLFGYYQTDKEPVIKKKDSSNGFICSAYTFDEITDFIPENIEVDNNTYLARTDGYDKLRVKKWEHISATINYQRTHIKDTPFMAICRCKGRMVAFSITEDGKYNNLITWGYNQAEAAGLLLIELFRENKIPLKLK